MHNNPVIDVIVPLGDTFILFVFFWRDKVFDDHILEFKLVCQLVDGIKHIIPFAIKIILTAIQLILSFRILLPKVLKFLGFKVKFFLDVVELMLGVQEIKLLLLQFLLEYFLLFLLLGKMLLCLFQFLSLFLGNLNGLCSEHHLFFHFLKPVHKFLLLVSSLFLTFFFFLDFSKENLFLLFLKVCLAFNFLPLFFGLSFDIRLFFFESLLKLLHLLEVLYFHNLLLHLFS